MVVGACIGRENWKSWLFQYSGICERLGYILEAMGNINNYLFFKICKSTKNDLPYDSQEL
jgi:hypothetical protein